MHKHLLSLLNGNDLVIIKKIPRLSIWIVLIRGTPFAIDAKDGKQYVSKVIHKKNVIVEEVVYNKPNN